ncbi:polysaccharide deacetylase family protein [Streptomyces sp. NPDC091268]|uniref:polysaccharide deacetylase family protein n=1 Tax=Streptomyces sp. NPDC091268 TaxID=3365979 RepID=UPI003809B37A
MTRKDRTRAPRPHTGGAKASIAIAASAAAVAATVWAVATVVEPGHHPPRAEASARSAAPVRQQVPEGITHDSEAGKGAVDITIDDGPDPTWTPKVLHVLAKYDAKAVFCMIGPRAKDHPDLVKQVVAAGHRLCDHTMDHDVTMDKKPVAYQEQQILDARALIEEAAGGRTPVAYYRAPGGAFTLESRRIAAAQGMRPLGWNVDSKDFAKPGAGTIAGTVEKEIENGPTVLFHDGGGNRSQTVEALDRVLSRLKEEGRPTGFPVRTGPSS